MEKILKKVKIKNYQETTSEDYIICCAHLQNAMTCSYCGEEPGQEYIQMNPGAYYQNIETGTQEEKIFFQFELLIGKIIKGKTNQQAALSITGNYGEFRLELNTENGCLQMFGDGLVADIMQEHDVIPIEDLLAPFVRRKDSLFKQFIEECVNRRGISYLEPHDLLRSREAMMNGLKLISIPELHLLPFSDLPRTITNEERARAKGINREIDLYKALTGHKSKTLRALARDRKGFELLSLFGPYFKENDHVLSLLNTADHDLNEFYSNNLEDYHHGMKLLRSFHENENVFFRRVWKHLSMNVGKMWVSVFFRYIEDIGRMHKEIKRFHPDYEAVFEGEFKKFHDVLSKDYHRIKLLQSEAPFHYTKEEKRLEAERDGFSFQLAENEKELIQIGTRMDICVGSYGDKVKKRQCVIVTAKNEKGEVCIEIARNAVIQAKTKHNSAPNEIQRKAILEWAQIKGLRVTTEDLL